MLYPTNLGIHPACIRFSAKKYNHGRVFLKSQKLTCKPSTVTPEVCSALTHVVIVWSTFPAQIHARVAAWVFPDPASRRARASQRPGHSSDVAYDKSIAKVSFHSVKGLALIKPARTDSGRLSQLNASTVSYHH